MKANSNVTRNDLRSKLANVSPVKAATNNGTTYVTYEDAASFYLWLSENIAGLTLRTNPYNKGNKAGLVYNGINPNGEEKKKQFVWVWDITTDDGKDESYGTIKPDVIPAGIVTLYDEDHTETFADMLTRSSKEAATIKAQRSAKAAPMKAATTTKAAPTETVARKATTTTKAAPVAPAKAATVTRIKK